MKTLFKEASEVLDKRIEECENIVDVVTVLHDYIDFDLKPTTLGKAFEKMYANDSGFSPPIKMSELIGYHRSFITTNGSTWCRSNISYLGKKYEIVREHKGGRISSIRLDGFNKKRTISNNIRKDILEHYKKIPCVVLDINTNLECDHKDGLKDDWRLNDKKLQRFEDFQSMCKTVNDAKGKHCTKCKKTGIRFDAKRLGYSVSYLYGNSKTKNCEGCYWFNPQKFNKIISENYIKPDERQD